ncbi:iron-sulfur cluster assembly accessory protein [Oscillochloris trichoides DG-6]|uniref:Iron-sulfur cluster assembly accessory protein n=1 Tax=Oscillochloris trichoides DG-6 TaxID=765420 RepID=E1ICP1_9CHLR|nr:iron-sulfur cluster assembly accessory protein [Oscillochloris trichoides]EFO81061.1 iron-sulfur cluster assembly accessory protein [Oscillochloris trichoides DG-6]
MTTTEQDLVEATEAQPMIRLTEAALDQLVAMQRERQVEGYPLRVFVHGGGCSGFQYGMIFDSEPPQENDHEFEAGSLRVRVDLQSALYLTGASIDFVVVDERSGFKIDNPNAVTSCGCGHSFRTASEGGEEGAEDNAASGCGGCCA